MPTFLGAQRKASEPSSPQPVPEEVAFKLTNQCNLRCAHCYQWNAEGHHHDLSREARRQHLPFAIIADVFEATRALGSNVYLWGGEPLMYRHWQELADLLERDPRWTSICTNGTLIKKRLPSLLKISPRLEMDIAVDGLQAEHDGLRGEGAFMQTLEGVGMLVEEKRRGSYRGEITVNCVVTDNLVPHLVDVVSFWNEVGIDTLYLALLWYVSDQTSAAMDRYVAEHLPWTSPDAAGSTARQSWHAYKHRMNPGLAASLAEQLERIDGEQRNIKVRYNPAVPAQDLEHFLSGDERPAAKKSRCLAVLSRMDVLANGDVVSCKFFPESSVGNLRSASVETVWHGPRFRRFRETITRCGLMPVCSKCSLLYSRGV